MTVYSIQRCIPDDEKIIFDTDHQVLKIYGKSSSFTAPLHSVELRHIENTAYEGGQISIESASFCGNVELSLAEYIQAFHYFSVINNLEKNNGHA